MLVELGQQFGLPAPQPADMGLDPADLRLGEIDRIQIRETIRLQQNTATHHADQYDGRGVTETRSDTKISKTMPENICYRPTALTRGEQSLSATRVLIDLT